jgi:hypothetical protein
MMRNVLAPLTAMVAAAISAVVLVGSGAIQAANTGKPTGTGVGGAPLPDLTATDMGVLSGGAINLSPLDAIAVPPKVTQAMLEARWETYWASQAYASISYDYALLTSPSFHSFPPNVVKDDPTLGHMSYAQNLPVWVVSLHGVKIYYLNDPTPEVGTIHYLYDAYSGDWLGTWT